MSVVAAKGFRAAGVASGIKSDGLDIALLCADVPAVTAGVFTRNQMAAAPVLISRGGLGENNTMSCVVINSGCANAATGPQGFANARTMAETAANSTGVAASEVLVCSTGTIGSQLPMEKVTAGIDAAVGSLSDSSEAGTRAATAIMTTDAVPKQATVYGDGWAIGGMAKGAGMVRPSMATMLGFITTDAVVDRGALDKALRAAVDVTFNSLNIDGCESTNDSVIVMASGASGQQPDPVEFARAMEDVCRDLALQMAADAEGSSRVVTIEVSGARDDRTARYLGRLVSDSVLVRSSFYGGDPNWGRILGALGTADVEISPGSIAIEYQGVEVFANGAAVEFDEQALLDAMEIGDFEIAIRLDDGSGGADVVTADLTPEYVVFNGERS